MKYSKVKGCAAAASRGAALSRWILQSTFFRKVHLGLRRSAAVLRGELYGGALAVGMPAILQRGTCRESFVAVDADLTSK
eukprot:1158274-Pelagomonas_calceolata.AAC.18